MACYFQCRSLHLSKIFVEISEIYAGELDFRNEGWFTMNLLQQYITLHLNAHCFDDNEWLSGEFPVEDI